MMSALIGFIRELTKELRDRSDALNTSVDAGRIKYDLLREVASAIESAAKRTLYL
jgi:hypothetical protein